MKRENLVNLSLLLLRTIIGIVFIIHGTQKLYGMFGGMGLEGTAKMIEGLGLGSSHIVARVWAYLEFVSGILLVLGVLVRLAAASIVFSVVLFVVKASVTYGAFLQNSDMEYGLLVVGACVPLVLLGGGGWSIWDN